MLYYLLFYLAWTVEAAPRARGRDAPQAARARAPPAPLAPAAGAVVTRSDARALANVPVTHPRSAREAYAHAMALAMDNFTSVSPL